MKSIVRKLKHVIPSRPGIKFCITSGTNSIREWLLCARRIFSVNLSDNTEIVDEYERKFSKIVGTNHAISFGAGRMALYAILKAINIEEGDEVIIPAFTCVVVPNAIIYCKALPVYVDIDPETFNIDIKKIESMITSRTKAIYAQHTFGLPCNMDEIKKLADEYGLIIIEDAAHALGSFKNNKPVGSLSDVSFFSTDHTKTISTHVGGIAATNNHILAKKIRKIQLQSPYLSDFYVRQILLTFMLEYILFSPFLLWLGRPLHVVLIKFRLLFYFTDELEIKKPEKYPYPCRLSSVLAEIGISQLKDFEKNQQHRRLVFNYLERKIKWNAVQIKDFNSSIMLRYSFLVKDRNEFEMRFKRYFDLGIWFTSIVQGRQNKLDRVCYISGSCPIAEYVADHIVNFPTHSRISIKILKKEVEKNLKWVGDQMVHFDIKDIN